MSGSVTLRRYTPNDEAETIALWVETWQAAYPHIDFSARRDFLRMRWQEAMPVVVLALVEGAITGLITVEAETGYVDQLAVSPRAWGSPIAAMLMDEVKRLSPRRLHLLVNQDNARAIRFYEKQGFVNTGPDKDPRTGTPVFRMRWAPHDVGEGGCVSAANSDKMTI